LTKQQVTWRWAAKLQTSKRQATSFKRQAASNKQLDKLQAMGYYRI